MVVYFKERWAAGIWLFLFYFITVGGNGHQITMVIAFIMRYIFHMNATILIRHLKGCIIIIMMLNDSLGATQ